MSANTLTDRSNGQTIDETFFNDIHQAFNGDFVGRDSSGVPASGKNLGTNSIPWGTVYSNAFVLNGAAIDTSQIIAPTHRVVSGATRSGSNQPLFLDPAGTGNGPDYDILGAATSLVYSVAGSSFTLSSDLNETGLATAPSSNNTALVNDSDAADGELTRTWGEIDAEKDFITIDNVGSEISSLVGTFQAFKINDGSNDEYFYAYIETSTKLSKIFRGYYYDSSGDPINRITFANNDTITLMKAHHVFLDSNATTVDTTVVAPVYSSSAPTSPATGDYWFDTVNSVWKRYDGADFQTVSRAYLGQIIVDDTDAVGARSEDFDARYRSDNGIALRKFSSAIVELNGLRESLQVAGKTIQFLTGRKTWNMTTDLASAADMYNASEQSDTAYYMYVSDEGENIISDISPYKRMDLYGRYHPHNPWRCVGVLWNDNSSDIQTAASYEQPMSCDYRDTVDTSVPNATSTTVQFADKRHDLTDAVTGSGTANWQYRVVIPGIYQVSASIKLDSSTYSAGDPVRLEIAVNAGADPVGVILKSMVYQSSVTQEPDSVGGSVSIRLFQGDEFDIRIFQGSGTTRSTKNAGAENYVSVQKTHSL